MRESWKPEKDQGGRRVKLSENPHQSGRPFEFSYLTLLTVIARLMRATQFGPAKKGCSDKPVNDEGTATISLTPSRITVRPTVTTRTAAIVSAKARTPRPAEYPPVWLLSQPMMEGPKNPPVLLIELMSAMPPAAAVPPRYAVGKVQNTDSAAWIPAAATVSAISTPSVECNKAAAVKPSAPSSAAEEMCQMRSLRASLDMPQSTITTMLTIYGTATIKLVSLFVNPIPLTICGSHRLMP